MILILQIEIVYTNKIIIPVCFKVCWYTSLFVTSAWNEGTYDGEVFFLFDSKERGSHIELLQDMVKFAKTNSAGLNFI